MKNILYTSGLLVALGTTTLYADQFAAAPGTKARSMGYAFSAVANNSSALYYNPAGFVSDSKYSVFTLEGGTASSWDETDNNDAFSSDTQYFIGGGSFTPEGGWGFAIYSLYDIYFTEQYDNGYDTSRAAHQSNEVIHWAGSWRLHERFSMGLGVGYVTKIFSSDTNEDENGYETAKSHNGYSLVEYDSYGGFFQFGLLADVLKDDETGNKLTLSYTYRSEADMKEKSVDNDYGYSTTIGVEPFDLPEEQVIGAAIHYATAAASFLITYDIKTTTYTYPEFASSDTTAMGIEIGFEGLSFRAGAYESTPQNSDYSEALEVKGTTYGINKQFGNVFAIEFAVDNRKMDGIDSDNTFSSLSLNFVL
ncbi:MAG: hypothetical protein U9R37_02175 [Campylobacterota bacterium]|nr:hypothetical protein [Campylobacterota bacterium]